MSASSFYFKIFVRNLPWTVSSHELRTYFSQFGYVSRASVLYNPDTGLSRGFGHVDFIKRDAFDTVMSQPTHILEGQRLRIEEGQHGNKQQRYKDNPLPLNRTITVKQKVTETAASTNEEQQT
ncbi:unnamed protein product [Didymodactylos carnosus]|uniref:RRM domain-containing protein n=1 Tax=Didymodactylos carnosus TaxID=1234261 RepID=A0A813Y9B5_9BILA|nr:unnamed protein product [Didymodactylos carnosus]CAF1318575.1 unnamed protein product [Didymodactylos carnosus]CAF3667123.1 unnamed protein product [Didymodactylos carnosus]CAF4128081.1 unnamed protein product [Didymodactylos carnosus]